MNSNTPNLKRRDWYQNVGNCSNSKTYLNVYVEKCIICLVWMILGSMNMHSLFALIGLNE